MTPSSTDPAAPTAPAAEPAPVPADARPAPHGLLRATAVIATVGVVVALIGLVLLVRPVSTPTQDCGTSLAFLLGGRVDQFVSETDPPKGITPAEAKANNARPCRERVAERAKPAGVLIASGLLAAIIAVTIEVAVRGTAWWRRRQGPAAPAPTS